MRLIATTSAGTFPPIAASIPNHPITDIEGIRLRILDNPVRSQSPHKLVRPRGVLLAQPIQFGMLGIVQGSYGH